MAEVVWLHGSTEVADLGIVGTRAVPLARLHEAIAAADLVVAHAGIGSAIAALDRGHAPLLVPRRAYRGEAVDDHQLDIGRAREPRIVRARRRIGARRGNLARAAARRVQRVDMPRSFEFG